MARPTKYAVSICAGLSVLAAIGIIAGLAFDELLVTAVFLMPTAAYEAYRTEGRSTRWASWTLLVLLIGLLLVRVFDIDIDLRELVGADVVRVGEQDVPLGDLTVVFPAAMAVLAAVLWTRTRGVYTRWLAGVIFVTSAVVVHLAAPDALGDLFGAAPPAG